MIVVLMGYMGSGKSTIGKQLATILNYNLLDLDDYISENEGSTISDLFNVKGEIYFRKKETYYLNEVINTKDNIVLALGGGTPCYSNNLDNLISNTKVKLVYLKLSIPLLAKRLFHERNTRPVISHLNSEDQLTEFIGKHLFERTQYYNKADYIITTDKKTEQEVLETIVMQLI